MRFYESRQSSTSPLKYVLEMSPKEAGVVQEELVQLIRKLESSNKEEQEKTDARGSTET